MTQTSSNFQASQPVVETRGVHLDLKGVPPTPQRLLEMPRIAAAAGYNAMLVEWEDSFPWKVDERFRSPTAYTPDDIRRFADTASSLDIEIIPLVQCLGHMETPLNVSGYEHLRELPHDAYVLNPLARGARDLVQGMIDDVVSLLPGTRRLHLGGDEAWSLGRHPDTAAFIGEHGKAALYLRHVEPLLDSLNSRSIRPILWHDMMIDWEPEALQSLAKKSDLMPWGYRGHPDDSTSHYNTRHIQRLHEAGFNLWGGTAYKGADGPNIDRPNLANRRENALAWMEVAQRFGFTGVVATAWSRYSTHRLQCEPIDAALDSLIDTGIILHDGKPPANPADCIAIIDTIGEKDHFLACKAAMEELTAVRGRGWKAVQALREQIAMSENDPRRRGSSWEARFLKMLRDAINDSESVAEQVRSALDGKIAPVWIDEYLHSRLAALRSELADLERAVREIDPAAWEAGERGELAY